MPVTDQLGSRMKEYYEFIPKTKLVRRMPVVIRLDGKTFHSFTRGFNLPFDMVLRDAMNNTMKYLCENIQGCVLGYCQSDEISLCLIDYKNLDTSGWFDYEVQKMVSISASMATLAFNRCFSESYGKWHEYAVDHSYPEKLENGETYYYETLSGSKIDGFKFNKLNDAYIKAVKRGGMFDSRVFNVPREEVTNYFYWRQLDATRNSIQLAGQTYFSHNQLMHKSCNKIQDMLFTERGINWNNYDTVFKRGACCVRKLVEFTVENSRDPYNGQKVTRNRWLIDTEIPIFSGKGRKYIDSLVMLGS